MKITQAKKIIDESSLEPRIIFSGEYSMESAMMLDPSMTDDELLIMIGRSVMDGIRIHLEKDKND